MGDFREITLRHARPPTQMEQSVLPTPSLSQEPERGQDWSLVSWIPLTDAREMNGGSYFSPRTKGRLFGIGGRTDRQTWIRLAFEDGNGPTLDANSLTLCGWVDGGHLSNQLHRHHRIKQKKKRVKHSYMDFLRKFEFISKKKSIDGSYEKRLYPHFIFVL